MPQLQSPPGPTAVVDGREYLYFIGTGYLGLQGRPELIAAATEAIGRYGIASGTTRAGYGTTPPVRQVEQSAARFFGCEEALYFASGYLGNCIVVEALSGSFEAILIDEASHYSLWDAARLGGVPVTPFQHRDVGDLATKLQGATCPLVMTDGLFAAKGTIAPIAEYVELLRRIPKASLLVDDCHGFGVLGERGQGTYEYAGIPLTSVNRAFDENAASPRMYVTGTTSKAFGSFGGLIPGSASFIAQVKTEANPHAGASGPPIAAAAAAAKALEIVTQEPALRQRLAENAGYLRQQLMQAGLPVVESRSPVICLELDSSEQMRAVQQRLQHSGILIAFMPRYAGLGPAGALRIAVFAGHTCQMLDRLARELDANWGEDG